MSLEKFIKRQPYHFMLFSHVEFGRRHGMTVQAACNDFIDKYDVDDWLDITNAISIYMRMQKEFIELNKNKKNG